MRAPYCPVRLTMTLQCGARYMREFELSKLAERLVQSSTGTHSSWLQIKASGSSTLKKTSVGSFAPS